MLVNENKHFERIKDNLIKTTIISHLYLVLIVIFTLGITSICNSQIINNIGFKDSNCILVQDSLSILPSSVIIEYKNIRLLSNEYTVVDNEILGLPSLCKKSDSLKISYRTFDFRFGEVLSHLDTTQMVKKDIVYIGYDYSPFKNSNNQALISGKGLDYNGSFTRGFSVGNSQSLVLNSNFNLQLAGDLGNGLKIVAAISDDNIPIQPEGNTQSLQEFDQVYIRLTKDKTSVVAGDYQQQSRNSYFMKYFKKLKGASVNHGQSLSTNKKVESRASFAVSKGKFNRLTLPVEEGNQGPYKLTGANGERFLIVLAGSERVYYDGVLLERGEDFDYSIDYNRAEIVFTPKRIVARESRIIIEYEYTDQNYLRTLYTVESNYTSDKLKISTQFYSEQDSKNGSGQAALDSIDKQILATSGDNLMDAVRSGVNALQEDASDQGRITYIMLDHPTSPNPDDFILKYSIDTNMPLFTAIFSEVEGGNGDYIIDNEIGTNGRVYKYVGTGMGTYLPTIRIVPPEQKQMLTSRIEYQISKNATLYGELGWTNLDINRLSILNKEDNQGLATNIGYKHEWALDSTKLWRLSTDLNYEYVDEKFNPLNPYRAAEFSREWNITEPNTANEQIIKSVINLQKGNQLSIRYGLSSYERLSLYEGRQHYIDAKYNHKGWNMIAKGKYLASEGYGKNSLFVRPKINISKTINKLGGWTIEYGYEQEKNEVIQTLNQSLQDRSFDFNINRFIIENNQDNQLTIKIEAKQRSDQLPINGALVESIKTNELSAESKWKINDSNNLKWTLGARDFEVIDQEAIDQQSKTTILSRIAYNIKLWNGLLSSTMNYDISSGQEPKQEFTYEKVEPGQGNYIYIGNSSTPEEDELFLYEYSEIDTANYIKIFLFNNEFIRTNNQSLNISLRINPHKVIKNKKNFFRKFATNHSIRFNQKVEDNGEESNFQPLNFSLDNVSLTSYRSLIANTLFFNRTSTAFDIQLGNRLTENRNVQIVGIEDRGLAEYFSRLRFQIISATDFIVNVKTGTKTYESNFFSQRNFHIKYWNVSPEINWRPTANWRIISSYQYDTRQQQLSGMETANSHDITFESTYRRASKSSYNLSFSLVNVEYNGAANSTIEYDLLDGLKDGKNYLWNLNITRRMAKNVDLNISYDGRKTGISPIVHVARAQVKATF